MTPKQIVKELDRYIIGQENAKKAVAIALRNRWRRKQIKGKLKTFSLFLIDYCSVFYLTELCS